MANKTDRAKALIVDWNVISPATTERIYALTDGQIAALTGIAQSLYWQKRYQNLPDKQTAIDFANDTIARLTMPIDFCQILQECGVFDALDALQTSVDGLATSVGDVQNTVNNINNTTNNNAASNPPAQTLDTFAKKCGGALAVLEAMHNKNMQIYAQAEGSVFDNASEVISSILSSIPAFQTLPAGVLGQVAQAHFENQVTQYEADYNAAKNQMAGLLACYVLDAGGAFTYDVWGAWLDTLDADVPGNAAAAVLARYAPVRQTFVNQIAAFFNQNASLQTYFNELYSAYSTGENNPSAVCSGCPTEATYLWDFTTSNGGWVVNSANQGVWVNGQGWVMQNYNGGGGNLYVLTQIKKAIPAGLNADSMRIGVVASLGGNLGGRFVSGFYDSTPPSPTIPTVNGGANYDFDLSVQTQNTDLFALARASHANSYAGSGRITNISITGTWAVLPALTGGVWL